jgi:hypothetical protein
MSADNKAPERETLYWNRNSFGSLSKMPQDTHKITFDLKGGKMATGVFTNENGDVIEVEEV